MRHNHIFMSLFILTLISSCGSKNGAINPLADSRNTTAGSNEVITKEELPSNILSVIGTSFTKKILIETNKDLKSQALISKTSMNQRLNWGALKTRDVTPHFNELKSDNISFDKDLYLSTVNKIAEERAKFSDYEMKQKFALKTASYTTDAVFAAASTASGGMASIIVDPLKSMRNDAFDAAISATVENNNIQMGKVISLLAQSTGGELLKKLKSFNNDPEELNQIRIELIKKAKEKMSSRDSEIFSSQLKDEYLASGMTYALTDLKNINTTVSNVENKLNEATNALIGTKNKVDELAHNLKVLAESNTKFLTEQRELLKTINSNIAQNNAGVAASLVKLDFLTQMTFGSLPASMQLEYLKKSDHLIPLSTEEKNKLRTSLEFKVQAETAIQVISAFKTIGTNLDFLGRDGIRILDVSSTLLTSAISFMSGNPLGYINGVASLSSLFAKKQKADPRLDMILENQRKTFEALRNINDNINLLRTEINESFKKINEEIFISRAIQLGNIRKDDLSACNLISADFNTPVSYFKIKEDLSSEGREIHLSECLVNLTKFFSNPDYNEENMTFTMNLSYRKNNLNESTLINSYAHIYEALENEGSEDVSRSKFNLKTILDPDMLNYYIVELLNNHHWYDITESSRAGWSLVKFENLKKNIESNKISEKMLKNALFLVEANLYQHHIWSGVSSLDFFYDKYVETSVESAKKVNCANEPKHVLCIATENPWFFNNLLNHIIQKDMTYDYFFGAGLVAPNDPDYLNESMKGAFRFVWLGEGASSLFTGEVVTNPKIIKTFGNGMFVKVVTADRVNFYPVPVEEYLKKKVAYDMPKTNLLLKLKKVIQDEILDLNLKKILEDSEYIQTLQFL